MVRSLTFLNVTKYNRGKSHSPSSCNLCREFTGMSHKWLLILLFPLAVLSQEGLIYRHSSNGQIINHDSYAISYSEDHEQAEWVSYSLNGKMLTGSAKRINDFRQDKQVVTGSSVPNDYTFSGFDRGHLAPAGDMGRSVTAMSESFLMSNISPQRPSFNRGGWKKLEGLVRTWAMRNEIQVVTAGILNDSTLLKIGANRVTVPKYFYKIIYNPNEMEMICFLMPNKKITQNLESYVTSVDQIEQITGIDFFYNLPDELENHMESSVNIRKWSFRNAIDDPNGTNLVSSSRCKGVSKSTGRSCAKNTKNKNQLCYAHQNQALIAN